MKRLFQAILTHPKRVLVLTACLMAVSAVLAFCVPVNYDLADYLPEDAPSTQALETLNEAFGTGLPNLNAMAPDVSVQEALALKARLRAVDGVSGVMWLDDVADVLEPLETLDPAVAEAWYKDGAALFMLTCDAEKCVSIVSDVRAVIGEGCLLSGDIMNQAQVRGVSMGEVTTIMLYVVPLVLIILLLTTSSWFEPVLFILTIGVAILVNMGTNAFMPNVSYITQATSAVLQLAVSMDYAVFLLHRFAKLREGGLDVRAAMLEAMTQSFSSVASSALTTVFGFLSLMLMRFRMGPDMGFVLAKGVLISFISVIVLLPALTILTHKWMDRMTHRSFLPTFKGFARVVTRVCVPVSVILIVLIVPSYLATQANDFIYGSSGMHSERSQVRLESNAITERFGQNEQMVIVLKDEGEAREAELTRALSEIPNVRSVTGYASTVGVTIPSAVLPASQIAALRSNGYSRLIVSADTNDESAAAFRVVDSVRAAAESLYGDRYALVGQSVVNKDLKDTITADNLLVNLGAALSIAVVLLFTFRSLSLPIFLLLPIEGAIFINMAIPYFAGDSLNYIGYQIVSAMQLGATVDYGILLCSRYLRYREDREKHEAIRAALMDAAGAILSPAMILTVAGLMLGVISTNGVISQLGIVLGRGAAISAAMVLLLLPALLTGFDGFIRKTTLPAGALRRRSRKTEQTQGGERI